MSSHKASDLLKLLANRRSYYTLKSSSTISDSTIQSILKEILLTVPSAFNTQSTRMVLALGAEHREVWQTTASLLKKQIGEERFAKGTEAKIAGFEKAYGTILFYDDPTDVEVMKGKFPNYAHHFGGWSEHSQGMHQLAAWVALEAEGMGANLQHYNGVIDEDVANLFHVPKEWKLKAQLVFGEIEGGRPDEKPKKSTDETLKVFGAKE